MMWQLIYIEWFKLLRQSRTYWAIGAIVLIEALVFVGAYVQGKELIELLLDNLRKSFFFEGELLNGNLIIYLLLNTLWFHLPLILMIVVSGMFTTEYKDKTLEAVFLQPIKKRHFILAKYIVALQFTLLVLMVLAISTALLAYSIFGKGDLIVYLGTLNFFTHETAQSRIFYALLSGGLSMCFFAVVSLTLAIWLKEVMTTWIACTLLLICTNLLLKIDLRPGFLNDWLFIKLIDGWQFYFLPKVPWSQIVRNAGLLVGYIGLFVTIGIYSFVSKDVE